MVRVQPPHLGCLTGLSWAGRGAGAWPGSPPATWMVLAPGEAAAAVSGSHAGWSGHLERERAGERGAGLSWLGAACPPLPFTSLARVLHSQGFRGRHSGVLAPPHPGRVTAKAGSRSKSLSPSFLEGPAFLEGCVLLQWRALSSGGLSLPHVEALVGVCVHAPPAAVSRARASTGQPKTQAWTGLSSPAVGFLVCKLSAGKRIFQVGLSLTRLNIQSHETTFIWKMSWAGLGGSVLLEGVGCVDSESRVLRSSECVCVSGGHFGCCSPRVTRSHPVWWPHILSVLQACCSSPWRRGPLFRPHSGDACRFGDLSP